MTWASPTLWRNGDYGYASHSRTDRASAVYLTAKAARRLIKKGVDVALSDGYTVDILDNICWITGFNGKTVKVSNRQANEIARIALTLVNRHGDELEREELDGAREAIQVVLVDK